MSIVDDLKDRALRLSDEDRAALARDLIASLEPAHADAGADEAWEAEVLKRLEAVDRGEVTTSPWREAVDRVRGNLKGRGGT